MIFIVGSVKIASTFIGCIPLYVRVFLLIYIGSVIYLFFVKIKFDNISKEILKDICESLGQELPKPKIREYIIMKYKAVSFNYLRTNTIIHRFGFFSSMLIVFHAMLNEIDLLGVFAGGTVCMIVINVFYYFSEYRVNKNNLIRKMQCEI